MPNVRRLSVLVLGERDQPLHPQIFVPTLLLGADLDAILARIQEQHPDATYESLVRALLIYGVRSVMHSLKSGLSVTRDGTIPAGKADPTLPPKARAAANAERLRQQREGSVD